MSCYDVAIIIHQSLAMGEASDETPLVCTPDSWESVRKVCGAPLVSEAAAAVVADWRRERLSGAGGGGGAGVEGAGGAGGEPSLAAVVCLLRAAAALNGSD